MNNVTLMGHLGKDPKWGNVPSGGPTCVLSVATNSDDDGEPGNQSTVEWHRVVLQGDIALSVLESLRKGDRVYVEGKLKTRKWTDASGSQRYITEVICKSIQVFPKTFKTLHAEAGQSATSCPMIEAWVADYDAAWAKERAAAASLESLRNERAISRHMRARLSEVCDADLIQAMPNMLANRQVRAPSSFTASS